MSHDRVVIRHAVEEIGFGFFSDDELRALSVKRITSPTTFDSLNQPLPGGLYDPALGPVDRNVMCETCGRDSKNCPGHMGHIELAVSVYHPLLFRLMFKLLRSKCFSCHHFRLAERTTRTFAVKIMLTNAGRWEEALELDYTLLGHLRQQQSGSNETPDEDSESRCLTSANTYRERVLGELEHELGNESGSPWCGGHNRTIRRELIDGFLKALAVPKKCENCGAVSPAIRQDGCTKLFQEPLSEKSKQINRACNTDIASAIKDLDDGPDKVGDQADDDSDPMSEDETDGEDVDGERLGEGPGPTNVGILRNGDASQRASKFMPPIEVEQQIKYLWKREAKVLDLVFDLGRAIRAAGKPSSHAQQRCETSEDGGQNVPSRSPATAAVEEGFRMFFIRALAVPPNRFRPPMQLGEMVAEHAQNVYLTKVLSLNEKLVNMGSMEGEKLSSALTTWIELQMTINCFMDSSKDPKGMYGRDVSPGVRQILEKKEGLFRKHMMGKRVNYACRSVISPDPCLGTTEIGIPVRFAMVLTYPEPVASWNAERLRHLVETGANAYPGANFVEAPNGRLVYLDKLSDMKRQGVAARLLSTPGQKVWRHLQDGDCMLVNRQPTLHKPGIMAHRVRVLRNPSYQTIRMHYANCNTYNADFDGDEINCHLPQNELAKAEAHLLVFTDEQYLVPTNGKPLRGLIQDHVDAGVKMCSKDCFFTREEYQQLVFQALAGLPGLEIVAPTGHIHNLPPAILKPRERWTGKQVISTILRHLTEGLPQLNLDAKTKTPAVAFGECEKEHEVLFREGELLQGVLDKAAFGNTEYGLVHAVHELYGSTAAGKLLTALGRILTIYLQYSGHTCGIEDLTLNAAAEGARKQLIHESRDVGVRAMKQLLSQEDAVTGGAPEGMAGGGGEEGEIEEMHLEDIRVRTSFFLQGSGRDGRLAEIDRHMQSALAPVSSDIIKACIPQGQEKPFPANCFSLMVLTGAKGSKVNHSQVSCSLGQQALEGRRVPIMVSGKSLPSFKAYEPSPRANGFITDRFLTGIRPQEYFFHCMAGREGLVDTAVKTSRSGYLQRCLVKHLEELKVTYDSTVRDGEGCVVQFLYGEDGVDTTQTKYLSSGRMDFMVRNYHALQHKYHMSSMKPHALETSKAAAAHAAVLGKGKESTGGQIPWKVGERVLALRQMANAERGWGQVDLDGDWSEAKILKVKAKSSGKTTYKVRYADGEVARIPGEVRISSESSEEGVVVRLIKGLPAGVPGVKPDPVLSRFNISRDLGCVSEVFQASMQSYLEKEPPALQALLRSGEEKIWSSGKSCKRSGALVGRGSAKASLAELKKAIELLMWVKYQRSLAAPGEAVGSIAAQSIGEPSTQMTLNTFHLAGHGGANVTLGIPRLREIIMTASKALKTPSTVVPLREGVSQKEADTLVLRLSRLSLPEILHNEGGITVREAIVKGSTGTWERHYAIVLRTFPPKLIRKAFGIDFETVFRKICQAFIPHLFTSIRSDLKRIGERVSSNSSGRLGNFRSNKSADSVNDATTVDGEEREGDVRVVQRVTEGRKAVKKAEAEYESDDDNDDQGTLTFGKRKERATYDEMDEDEKAMWKSMGAPREDAFDADGEAGGREGSWEKTPVAEDMRGKDDPLVLPLSVTNSPLFNGVRKNRSTGEVEITVKLTSSTRRLLMVGLVEASAAKTMVRSFKGMNRAFVVETMGDGASGLAVQVEGSCFETIWGLKEGGPSGVLLLNKLTSNDIWAMCETYGVEAARATIVSEIKGVFGAYGIAVDPRHLGLVADHMTFNGGYRALNRGGMEDFSSPCLQMSFETTSEFMTKAAVSGAVDCLKSPSARIVMGRVGQFGTGLVDLRQPA